MDEKYDVYVVVVDANNDTFEALSRLSLEVNDLAQGVDESTAYAISDTVGRYWETL